MRDPQALLTADELAERWGVCRETIYRMVRAGEIYGCYKLGRHYRFAPDARYVGGFAPLERAA